MTNLEIMIRATKNLLEAISLPDDDPSKKSKVYYWRGYVETSIRVLETPIAWAGDPAMNSSREREQQQGIQPMTQIADPETGQPLFVQQQPADIVPKEDTGHE